MLVVDLALLGIAQNVVSFLDFLEAVLGGFVARIQVGMMFAGKLTIGLAYLVFGRSTRHGERFIKVLLLDGHGSRLEHEKHTTRVPRVHRVPVLLFLVFHIHKLCIHDIVFAVFGFRIATGRMTVGARSTGGALCTTGLAG